MFLLTNLRLVVKIIHRIHFLPHRKQANDTAYKGQNQGLTMLRVKNERLIFRKARLLHSLYQL